VTSYVGPLSDFAPIERTIKTHTLQRKALVLHQSLLLGKIHWLSASRFGVGKHVGEVHKVKEQNFGFDAHKSVAQHSLERNLCFNVELL
jgi:hypothetical protein